MIGGIGEGRTANSLEAIARVRPHPDQSNPHVVTIRQKFIRTDKEFSSRPSRSRPCDKSPAALPTAPGSPPERLTHPAALADLAAAKTQTRSDSNQHPGNAHAPSQPHLQRKRRARYFGNATTTSRHLEWPALQPDPAPSCLP
jgi:hypothetical protein